MTTTHGARRSTLFDVSFPRIARLAVAFGLGCLLLGCPVQSTVILDVFTDFEPGEQFESVTYTFTSTAGGLPVVEGRIPAADFARQESKLVLATTGPRAFSPDGGEYEYRAELLDAAGVVVASYADRAVFVGTPPYRVHLEVTRFNCEGVGRCGAGETCRCGGCYAIACGHDEDLDGCPGACCENVGGCGEPRADCAQAACLPDNTCAWLPIDMACREGHWCDALLGCRPRSEEPDASTAPVDADRVDAGRDVDAGPGCVGDCDDGDPCNGLERCEAGSCRAGTPPTCDDLVACTADSCAASGCVHTPRDALCSATAGGHCDAADDCQYPICTAATCTPTAGACQEARCEGSSCLRTSVCTAAEECCGGACVAAGCDDDDPCTADSCGLGGCVHVVTAGSTCDDREPCTTGDVCRADGRCSGTALDCNDGNDCTANTCVAGACQSSPRAGACTLPHASGSCAGGDCMVTGCDAGFLDCTSAAGCETPFSTSACGACGVACGVLESCDSAGRCACGAATGEVGAGPACVNMIAHATGRCRMTAPRSCGIAVCDAGYESCDGADCNGCEVDTRTRVDHCGGCGRACAAGETCSGGTCRCGSSAACSGGMVCTSCGCASTAETSCLSSSGDEDCDGLLNCADDDCEGRICLGVHTCQAGGLCS